jgi:DNA polymerase-3 subunit alpha
LKNIGAAAVETIVSGRSPGGAYRSIADFAARLNPKALNKRGLETLASAGAFDALEPNRALVRANVEGMIALAHRQAENAAQGTSDLFGGGGGGTPALDLKPAKAWTPMERLQAEFEAIGFFLSGHPLDAYETVLKKLGVRRYVDFEAATQLGVSSGRLAGIVISARERRSQKGNKFAFALFSDASGQFEAVIFSDTLNACRDLLEGGTPVVLNVEAERDGDTVKMRVQSMEALDHAAADIERGLRIVFDTGVLAARRSVVEEFKAQLKPGQGGTRKGGEVRLVLPVGAREVELVLAGRFDVSPAQAGQLSTVPGVLEVVEI